MNRGLLLIKQETVLSQLCIFNIIPKMGTRDPNYNQPTVRGDRLGLSLKSWTVAAGMHLVKHKNGRGIWLALHPSELGIH